MDVDDESGSAVSKATVSFPVGLALLVTMLLGISVFFFCCLYWNRIQFFLYGHNAAADASDDDDNHSLHTAHEKPLRSDHTMEKQIDEESSSVTVLMPGDDVPKFIAMACPCEPHRITVVVHNPVDQ